MALVWAYRYWNSVKLLLAAVTGFGRGCSHGCASVLRRWLSGGVYGATWSFVLGGSSKRAFWLMSFNARSEFFEWMDVTS